MVPVRFVAEALGATVAWDDTTKTVAITTEDAVVEVPTEETEATEETTTEETTTEEATTEETTTEETATTEEAPKYNNDDWMLDD